VTIRVFVASFVDGQAQSSLRRRDAHVVHVAGGGGEHDNESAVKTASTYQGTFCGLAEHQASVETRTGDGWASRLYTLPHHDIINISPNRPIHTAIAVEAERDPDIRLASQVSEIEYLV
jgi:hypothetical protein